MNNNTNENAIKYFESKFIRKKHEGALQNRESNQN